MNQNLPSISSKPTGKEPWLAVCLSNVFPGIGQIYSGEKVRGSLWILGFIFLIISHLFLLRTQVDKILQQTPISQSNSFLGFGLIGLELILKIWNLFDAHACARKANGSRFEQARKSSKDPWLSVFLSTLLVGIGYFYIGNIFFGVICIFLVISSDFMPRLAFLTWLLSPLIAYHVYVTTPTRQKKSKRFLIPILLLVTFFSFYPSLSISSLISFSIRQYAIESNHIPTGSMLPTLKINDRLFANKLIYRFTEPKRGDIIIFKPTKPLQEEGFQEVFIKRIIGLPGETIEIIEDRVYINGNLLDEPYIDESSTTRVDICRNRNSYFSRREDAGQEIWEATVPSNSYLVMGDNRENSYDSRCWGTVPREYIVGKATKRF